MRVSLNLDDAPSDEEAVAMIRTAFKKDGKITAGNASGTYDGAAFVILASERKAKALGLRPIARVAA